LELKTILIPDANSTNVLAVIRRLGRAGFHVVQTMDLDHVSLSCLARSRYAEVVDLDGLNGCGRWPDLWFFLGGRRVDAVLPVGHVMSAFMSLNRDRLDGLGIRTCTPQYPVFKFGHDKLLTMEAAMDAGVPCPAFWGPEEWPGIQIFPLIVKGRKSCGVDAGVRFVSNARELGLALNELCSKEGLGLITDYSPLIQEYIPGDIYDVVGLYSRGSPRVAIAQRRVETIPLSGGPGVWNVTVDAPELVEQSCALLDHVGWHGPYQTEWVLDRRDNRFKLIELNPKLWGTLELAIRAGVDVPVLTARLALGEDIPQVMGYRVGVKKFWPLTNLLNFRESPSLRRGIMATFLPEMIDWRDPLPSIHGILAGLKRAVA